MQTNAFCARDCLMSAAGSDADISDLKHESSIFRSFIQPCMWFPHDGTD